MEPLASNIKSERCPRCGKTFKCSAEDIENCHCITVLLSDEATKYIALKYSSCLCNTCLTTIKQEYEALPSYYFENGLMVMTEKYHLQRGFCCKNGCRHCPYKFKLP